MLKVEQQVLDSLDLQYPGIRASILYFEALDLPSCPKCGSEDTAKVSTGIIGRTIAIAASTSKIRLLANGHPSDFGCNKCGALF